MNEMFQDRKKKVTRAKTVDSEVLSKSDKPVPDNMWEKCPGCANIIYAGDLEDNLSVCPHCSYHYRLSAVDRMYMTIDEDSFEEMDADLVGTDPLTFPGYNEKLDSLRKKTNLKDAVITGTAELLGIDTAFCFMDSNFLMGSMGKAVGEKISRAFEHATEHHLPMIIFTVSGGARMQEGIVSLMQMAKVSGAVARHSAAGNLYITVLTDPTTGGVTASFAMQGDIIISEPGALVGFAGKRVIEQTIKQSLPEGFQTAEFLMQKGFIDAIIERKNMRNTLYRILHLHQGRKHL